jgi:1,2-diacylglycerol 3-alpha-glucosyltransferase
MKDGRPARREAAMSSPVRVAIACPGVGHVCRGYETVAVNLFENLRGRVPVTLFKGAGPSATNERTVPCFRRTSALGRALSVVLPRRAYKLECSSFARSLHKLLRDEQAFDVVFVTDRPAATLLRRYRDTLPQGTRYAVAFHNGAPHAPKRVREFDLVQQVTGPGQDEATAAGLTNCRLLPIPIDVERFTPRPAPDELRRELALAPAVPLILCVAAHAEFKRIGRLIDAVAKIPPCPTPAPVLLVAGQEGECTASLKAQASEQLGVRALFRSFAYERMPDVFRLADVFALTSRTEGFGVVLLEAMATGLPVLSQRDPVRSWVVGDAGLLVDCAISGELTEALTRLLQDPDERRRLGKAGHRRVHSEFSWEARLPDFLRFFEEAGARVRPLDPSR